MKTPFNVSTAIRKKTIKLSFMGKPFGFGKEACTHTSAVLFCMIFVFI